MLIIVVIIIIIIIIIIMMFLLELSFAYIGDLLAIANLRRQLANGSVFRRLMEAAAAACFANLLFVWPDPDVSTQPTHMA
jgi:hypothetical protein